MTFPFGGRGPEIFDLMGQSKRRLFLFFLVGLGYNDSTHMMPVMLMVITKKKKKKKKKSGSFEKGKCVFTSTARKTSRRTLPVLDYTYIYLYNCIYKII